MKNLVVDRDRSTFQVTLQPNIGLDMVGRQSVIQILNITLADEALLGLKTRCSYWNMTGDNFDHFSSLLKQQSCEMEGIIDEIASRTRMLGGLAAGSFQEYLTNSRLIENTGEYSDFLELLADQEALIRFLREDAKKCDEEFDDAGTLAFLVEIIRKHEKMAWVLRSFIEPQFPANKKMAA